MLTRVFMVFVLAFWLVMTALLIRYTYYPEGSQFAEVPPRVVLKLFLDQGSKNNTMHIYHFDKKIGHASVDSRSLRFVDGQRGQPRGHALRISGLLEKGTVKSVPDVINWWLEIRLKNLEEMASLRGHIRMHGSGATLDFVWNAGERAPKVTLSNRGDPSADTQMMQLLLNQALGGSAEGMLASQGIVAPGGAPQAEIKTREGKMNLGGQRRNGYTLEIGALDRFRLKAFFTEAGELAIVTLPDGYRLIEPVIHGLAPEYGEEEE